MPATHLERRLSSDEVDSSASCGQGCVNAVAHPLHTTWIESIDDESFGVALGRFIDGPAQFSAAGPKTLVIDLGWAQPLYEAALTSISGTAMVTVTTLRQHEADGN